MDGRVGVRLAEIRQRISEGARSLIDEVLNKYLVTGGWAAGTWPRKRTVHGLIGFAEARKAVAEVSGSILYDEGYGASARYVVTGLGALVGSRGLEFEDLLVRYLGFVAEKFKADPEVAQVGSAEVSVALALDTENSSLLGTLVHLTRAYSESAGRSPDGSWTFGLPEEIEVLAESGDSKEWLEHEVLRLYSAETPKMDSERVPFLLRLDSRTCDARTSTSSMNPYMAPAVASGNMDARLFFGAEVRRRVKDLAEVAGVSAEAFEAIAVVWFRDHAGASATTLRGVKSDLDEWGVRNRFSDCWEAAVTEACHSYFHSGRDGLLELNHELRDSLDAALIPLTVEMQTPDTRKFHKLHASLLPECATLFLNGHRNEAVRKALEIFEFHVQELSGLRGKVGVALMGEAFSGKSPCIRLNGSESQMDRDEQDGYKFIAMGVMSWWRNTLSHGNIPDLEEDEASQRLEFVSYLLTRLVEAAERGVAL